MCVRTVGCVCRREDPHRGGGGEARRGEAEGTGCFWHGMKVACPLLCSDFDGIRAKHRPCTWVHTWAAALYACARYTTFDITNTRAACSSCTHTHTHTRARTRSPAAQQHIITCFVPVVEETARNGVSPCTCPVPGPRFPARPRVWGYLHMHTQSPDPPQVGPHLCVTGRGPQSEKRLADVMQRTVPRTASQPAQGHLPSTASAPSRSCFSRLLPSQAGFAPPRAANHLSRRPPLQNLCKHIIHSQSALALD